MTPVIEEAQVRHIARLARLELTAEEARLFSHQLADILAYVRLLEEVDTSAVEPLSHPLPLYDVWRDDVPCASLDTHSALANAPEREGSYFKVPAVLDAGGG